MKTIIRSSSTAVKTVFGSLALLAFLAFAQPQAAQAATSGGATIYNTVKVTYQSGTTTLFATANVSVTVNTVAALPTVTNPANQTVAAGAPVTYNYIVKSNSNGLDTYTTSALANTPTNISAATATSVTASVPALGRHCTRFGSRQHHRSLRQHHRPDRRHLHGPDRCQPVHRDRHSCRHGRIHQSARATWCRRFRPP